MLYNYSYAAWKQDDDDDDDVPESIDSLSGAASVDKKPSARDLSKKQHDEVRDLSKKQHD
jgi:hypothetical protein